MKITINLRNVGATLLILLTSLAAAQPVADYVLGPGDQVAISVFGEPDLSVEFTLSDNGNLSYPFLGEIRVAGLTMPELEKHIANGLRGDYLINPDVTVSIKQYRQFFLNGEVNRPGGYPYQPGLTLEKALALAGGLSPRANRSKIVVKRASELSGIAVNIKMSDPVRAGDVITVPQSFF
jgi:polysaccharide export outer membrane protein